MGLQKVNAEMMNVAEVGSVLQVKHEALTEEIISPDQNWRDAQTMSFTPRNVNSKILIMVNYAIAGKGAITLIRDGSVISSAPNGGDGYMFWQNVNQVAANDNSERQTMSMVIEDQPNTASLITYKTQILGYTEGGLQINPPPYRQGPAPVFSGMTIFEIKS